MTCWASSSHCILLLFLVAFVSPLVANGSFKPSPSLASILFKQSERIIKGFNLSPSRSINIVAKDPFAGAPKIVEKSFRFPRLSAYRTGGSNDTSLQEFGHHAGYFSLPNTKGARMFYYFFESRRNNTAAPVVVWLTGGPGCSSSLALFHENGPFHLSPDLSLTWNDFGWDLESNIIYIDQPTGTGFSYSTSRADIRSTSEEAGIDFYSFLQAFFKKHPEYAKNDLYITGESYAGHYIPAFAAEIQRRNKNKGAGTPINLKGIAIGNGMTNPTIQYTTYTEFALAAKIINKTAFDELSSLVTECGKEAQECGNGPSSSQCESGIALQTCNHLFNRILSYAPGINYYDIRKKCGGSLCYDFSDVDKFLNQKTVKDALGVKDIEFVSCSEDVQFAMLGDYFKNSMVYIPPLLQDGVKVLIYAGEYDLICNWLGNSKWLDDMKWAGQNAYLSANNTEFVVGTDKFGLQKSSGPLTFLKLYNAGHLVPMDQPKASLEMLSRWMAGKPL